MAEQADWQVRIESRLDSLEKDLNNFLFSEERITEEKEALDARREMTLGILGATINRAILWVEIKRRFTDNRPDEFEQGGIVWHPSESWRRNISLTSRPLTLLSLSYLVWISG